MHVMTVIVTVGSFCRAMMFTGSGQFLSSAKYFVYLYTYIAPVIHILDMCLSSHSREFTYRIHSFTSVMCVVALHSYVSEHRSRRISIISREIESDGGHIRKPS
jgi:hypothetical protein